SNPSIVVKNNIKDVKPNPVIMNALFFDWSIIIIHEMQSNEVLSMILGNKCSLEVINLLKKKVAAPQ
ncbi:hypothetical protein, partial [Klebsiella quasipneumoniae]|uniref:hypothetical protein n=1 Tax=Klebsiella quasipneumoniae TaxID=1463165 RepID=UPI001CFF2A08